MKAKTPPVVAKLAESAFFSSYQDAFRKATGLKLALSQEQNEEGGLLDAVPVPLGRSVVAYLSAVPATKKFPEKPPSWKSGIRVILKTFALQLGARANRTAIADAPDEPTCVVKAKDFIRADLAAQVSLEDVAASCGVTPFYVCRIFKRTTGMTLTEFVGRSRVEQARRELLRPDYSITGIAFGVGFRSLSQFNRSFLKFSGESPTEFREHGQFGLKPQRGAA